MSQTKTQLVASPLNLNGADLTFPSTQGSADQILRNGSTPGTLEFGAVALSAMPTGSILQVKQTHLNTTSSQSLTGGTIAEISGLSVTITPVSLTSNMLVFVRWCGEVSTANNYNVLYGIRRDSTDLGQPAASGLRPVGLTSPSMGYWTSDANSTTDQANYNFLDTTRASGTSAITYKATVNSANSQTLFNQTTVSNTNTADFELTTSTMIVMEVAA